jgi:hypothetical protein
MTLPAKLLFLAAMIVHLAPVLLLLAAVGASLLALAVA